MKLDFEIRFCVKHIAHGGKVMVMQWDWLFQTFHLGSLFFDNFPNVKQIATCLSFPVENLNPQVMQSNDLKVDESSLTGESDQVQIFQSDHSSAKTQSYNN